MSYWPAQSLPTLVLLAGGVEQSGAGGSRFLEEDGTFLSKMPLILLLLGRSFKPSRRLSKKELSSISGSPTTWSMDFMYLKSATAMYLLAKMSYSTMLMNGKLQSCNTFTLHFLKRIEMMLKKLSGHTIRKIASCI